MFKKGLVLIVLNGIKKQKKNISTKNVWWIGKHGDCHEPDISLFSGMIKKATGQSGVEKTEVAMARILT